MDIKNENVNTTHEDGIGVSAIPATLRDAPSKSLGDQGADEKNPANVSKPLDTIGVSTANLSDASKPSLLMQIKTDLQNMDDTEKAVLGMHLASAYTFRFKKDSREPYYEYNRDYLWHQCQQNPIVRLLVTRGIVYSHDTLTDINDNRTYYINKDSETVAIKLEIIQKSQVKMLQAIKPYWGEEANFFIQVPKTHAFQELAPQQFYSVAVFSCTDDIKSVHKYLDAQPDDLSKLRAAHHIYTQKEKILAELADKNIMLGSASARTDKAWFVNKDGTLYLRGGLSDLKPIQPKDFSYSNAKEQFAHYMKPDNKRRVNTNVIFNGILNFLQTNFYQYFVYPEWQSFIDIAPSIMDSYTMIPLLSRFDTLIKKFELRSLLEQIKAYTLDDEDKEMTDYIKEKSQEINLCTSPHNFSHLKEELQFVAGTEEHQKAFKAIVDAGASRSIPVEKNAIISFRTHYPIDDAEKATLIQLLEKINKNHVIFKENDKMKEFKDAYLNKIYEIKTDKDFLSLLTELQTINKNLERTKTAHAHLTNLIKSYRSDSWFWWYYNGKAKALLIENALKDVSIEDRCHLGDKDDATLPESIRQVYAALKCHRFRLFTPLTTVDDAIEQRSVNSPAMAFTSFMSAFGK